MSKITPIPQNTFISFRGNKTVDTAKQEKSNNCVNITDTGELYFNGKRLGTNDAEDKFFDDAINADGYVKAANVKTTDGTDIKSYVDNSIISYTSRVYRYRGSVPNLASLFRLACAIGDVYNVIDAFEIKTGDNAGKYPKGTNVVVTKAFNGNSSLTKGDESCIDPLSGITDLSNYVTTDTLETAKTELGGRIDKCAKTADVERDYLSKSDFDTQMLNYKGTLVLHSSDFPEATGSATNSMSQSELEFFKKINDAIRDYKQIVIVEDVEMEIDYYLVRQAYSATKTLSGKLQIQLVYESANSVHQIDIKTVSNNTGYSLKKTNTSLATEAALTALTTEVNNLKEQLKLA